jgi:hypothetical protein
MIKKAAAIAALIAVILVIGIGIAKAHPTNNVKPAETAHFHATPDLADAPEHQPTWDRDDAPPAKTPATVSPSVQPGDLSEPTAALKSVPTREPHAPQVAMWHANDPDDSPAPAAPRA